MQISDIEWIDDKRTECGRFLPDSFRAMKPEKWRSIQEIQRADTLSVFQIECRAQMASIPLREPREFYNPMLPRCNRSFPASSDATRGFGWFGLKWSSVAGAPATATPIAVLDVMSSGRSEPSSTDPRAEMTRRSFSQLAAKFAKLSTKQLNSLSAMGF